MVQRDSNSNATYWTGTLTCPATLAAASGQVPTTSTNSANGIGEAEISALSTIPGSRVQSGP